MNLALSILPGELEREEGKNKTNDAECTSDVRD